MAPSGSHPVAHRGGSQVVCILGTPRSGSSLTARVLNIAGLYIGGDDQVPPGSGNPTGFWEARRAARLNNRILRRMGIASTDAPRLPPGWEHSPKLATERNDARAVVAEVFGDCDFWGWKDPRNSLTLPLWRQAVSPTRHVICVRNPAESVASGALFGAERDVELDAATAYALWQCYMASAIANTAGRPRLFVAYESYFDDWRAAADRAARFVGLPSPIGTPREESICALFDDDLRHHHRPPAETLADPVVPAGVRSLYAALQPHLGGPSEPAVSAGGAQLDDLARWLLRYPGLAAEGE